MRATMMTFAFCLALLAFGCNAGDEGAVATTPAASELTPEELAAVALEVQSSPDRAEEILAARGLTEETFEQAVRDTAEDPEGARRYAAAFEGTATADTGS